jgi:predicted secreted protein
LSVLPEAAAGAVGMVLRNVSVFQTLQAIIRRACNDAITYTSTIPACPARASAGRQITRTVSLLPKIIVIPRYKLLHYTGLAIADSRRQSFIISGNLCSIGPSFLFN